MRHILIIMIAFFISDYDLSGQNGLLDQYIFSSEEDSMKIVDYLDPNTNYVFTLYGDWCGWCKKELRDYEDIYPQWQEDFNMKFVVLDDYGSDDIDQAIQSLSHYPYDIFVTKAIRMPLGVTGFPRNYFVSTGKQLVYEKAGYESPENMTIRLDQLFDKSLNSNLPQQMVQTVKLFDQCDSLWQSWYLNEEEQEFNGQMYKSYSTADHQFFIREESDYSKVYIYNQDSETEYTLIDFTKEICETVSIYSVLRDTILDFKVLDKYCLGEEQYIELDLEIVDCGPIETNLTFISGMGSNAGLIPFFDSNQCYSKLNCQWEEGGVVFSESGDCLLLNNEEIVQQDKMFRVWPNPVDQHINIQLIEGRSEGIVLIKTMHGEELIRTNIKQTKQLQLSSLPAGVYLLTFTSSRGRSYTEKIIIL